MMLLDSRFKTTLEVQRQFLNTGSTETVFFEFQSSKMGDDYFNRLRLPVVNDPDLQISGLF